MWPPRPRGHWRRPACRRRRRRGCSEAWLISAVGSIEALVRLESLYDTLTTHRRLPAERTETTRTSPQTTALSGLCQVLRSLTDRNRTSPTEQKLFQGTNHFKTASVTELSARARGDALEYIKIGIAACSAKSEHVGKEAGKVHFEFQGSDWWPIHEIHKGIGRS